MRMCHGNYEGMLEIATAVCCIGLAIAQRSGVEQTKLKIVEDNIGNAVCFADQYQCDTDSMSQCISNAQVCDGEQDCHDGSDEDDCSNPILGEMTSYVLLGCGVILVLSCSILLYFRHRKKMTAREYFSQKKAAPFSPQTNSFKSKDSMWKSDEYRVQCERNGIYGFTLIGANDDAALKVVGFGLFVADLDLGSNAHKAGVRVGMQITSINGVDVQAVTLQDFTRMRILVGEEITLTHGVGGSGASWRKIARAGCRKLRLKAIRRDKFGFEISQSNNNYNNANANYNKNNNKFGIADPLRDMIVSPMSDGDALVVNNDMFERLTQPTLSSTNTSNTYAHSIGGNTVVNDHFHTHKLAVARTISFPANTSSSTDYDIDTTGVYDQQLNINREIMLVPTFRRPKGPKGKRPPTRAHLRSTTATTATTTTPNPQQMRRHITVRLRPTPLATPSSAKTSNSVSMYR